MVLLYKHLKMDHASCLRITTTELVILV